MFGAIDVKTDKTIGGLKHKLDSIYSNGVYSAYTDYQYLILRDPIEPDAKLTEGKEYGPVSLKTPELEVGLWINYYNKEREEYRRSKIQTVKVRYMDLLNTTDFVGLKFKFYNFITGNLDNMPWVFNWEFPIIKYLWDQYIDILLEDGYTLKSTDKIGFFDDETYLHTCAYIPCIKVNEYMYNLSLKEKLMPLTTLHDVLEYMHFEEERAFLFASLSAVKDEEEFTLNEVGGRQFYTKKYISKVAQESIYIHPLSSLEFGQDKNKEYLINGSNLTSFNDRIKLRKFVQEKEKGGDFDDDILTPSKRLYDNGMLILNRDKHMFTHERDKLKSLHVKNELGVGDLIIFKISLLYSYGYGTIEEFILEDLDVNATKYLTEEEIYEYIVKFERNTQYTYYRSHALLMKLKYIARNYITIKVRLPTKELVFLNGMDVVFMFANEHYPMPFYFYECKLHRIIDKNKA